MNAVLPYPFEKAGSYNTRYFVISPLTTVLYQPALFFGMAQINIRMDTKYFDA
ncbi:MAG TPA: hypothetical protein VJB96_05845 [Patescibacteria group bacterium]|nr:hypothetical protein [Patescibacteria group bacterium]